MEMDAQTRELLERMRKSHVPPVHRCTVAEARTAMEKSAKLLGLPGPEVGEVRDLTIPGPDGGTLRVRRYRPEGFGGSELLPVVLFYHGGGFVVGSVGTHDGLARHLCSGARVLVVSVDYRLAPEHPFPCAVEDSYAAACWAAEHAREWGGDPGRLAVAGDSAGGNLAAVVCQLSLRRDGPEMAYQALLYPIVEQSLGADYPSRRLFGGEGEFLSLRDMGWFAGHYFGGSGEGESDPRASPIRASSLKGLPPALVLTAGFDPLRDEGRQYADRLSGDGVPVEYRCFESTIHGFLSFAGVLDAGRAGLDFVASRLKAALWEPGDGD